MQFRVQSVCASFIMISIINNGMFDHNTGYSAQLPESGYCAAKHKCELKHSSDVHQDIWLQLCSSVSTHSTGVAASAGVPGTEA